MVAWMPVGKKKDRGVGGSYSHHDCGVPNNTSPEFWLSGENPPIDGARRRRRDGVDGVGERLVTLALEFFRPLYPPNGLSLALLWLFL